MILIDFRQIANVTFHSGFKYDGYDADKFKQRFLSYLLFFKREFGKEYGDMIICLDSKNYWRREVFKYYKGSRAKARAKTEIDFKLVYELFADFTKDLRENFPWKVVEVDRAEADDIIGVLATKYHLNQKIMIISSDKDFLQLQQYPNIKQYSPMTKKLISEDHPEMALREKILRGDVGDGIPNCKTRDDIFMTVGKSETIKTDWVNSLIKSPDLLTKLTESEKIGYKRNELLIDLSNTPKDIKNEIDKVFLEVVPVPKSKVMKYLISNEYDNLIDMAAQF